MSAYDRILAALKRISPPWPSTDGDTSVGKELGSIARAFAAYTDLVDTLLDELLPDTTTNLIERWEKITRVPSVVSDAIETRRARVLAVLRRINGPRIAQLEQMLAGPLALDPNDMVWAEKLRSSVEELMTDTTGVVALAVPTTAPALPITLGKPWPGVVDDTGVSVYLALSSVGVTTAMLAHPDGTTWAIPVTASGWYSNRSTFTGKAAAGHWTISIRDTSAPTLTEARLMVSNNVDSGQIADVYLLRDPALPGSPDLITSQRLLHRTALANVRPFIVETFAFATGDPHSLTGRDPVGV